MLNTVFYLAAIGLFMTLSMAAPMLVGTFAGEFAIVARFGQYLVLGSFFFMAVLMSLAGRRRKGSLISDYVTAVSIWIIMPLFVALPMTDIGGLGYLDAVFETVSGLTTTGASVLKDIDGLPKAVLFWRSQVQWLGGLLSLLTVILLLAPSGIGGLPSDHFSSVSRGNIVQRQSRTFRAVVTISRVYFFMTLACFVALVLVGENPFHAVTLAMMALSTGGVLPTSGSLQSIAGQSATLVLALFLVVGATSIFWQRMVLRWHIRDLVKHRESYGIFIATLVLAIVFGSLLYKAAGSSDVLSPVAAITEGIFNAASLVSTNGLETREGVFALLPVTLVLFVIVIGGGTFSTAGGMKHYRIGKMISHSFMELQRLIYPHAIHSAGPVDQNDGARVYKAIWSYFIVAIASLSIGVVALNMSGISFKPSLVAAIAAFSNAGPVYNSAWAAHGDPAWLAYVDFATPTKSILMVLMILGRIEVLVLLGSLNLKYWLRR